MTVLFGVGCRRTPQATLRALDGAEAVIESQPDCTLTVPQTSDIHVISLQGETWIGEAKIVY